MYNPNSKEEKYKQSFVLKNPMKANEQKSIFFVLLPTSEIQSTKKRRITEQKNDTDYCSIRTAHGPQPELFQPQISF